LNRASTPRTTGPTTGTCPLPRSHANAQVLCRPGAGICPPLFVSACPSPEMISTMDWIKRAVINQTEPGLTRPDCHSAEDLSTRARSLRRIRLLTTGRCTVAMNKGGLEMEIHRPCGKQSYFFFFRRKTLGLELWGQRGRVARPTDFKLWRNKRLADLGLAEMTAKRQYRTGAIRSCSPLVFDG
jgi:hypothetical protein